MKKIILLLKIFTIFLCVNKTSANNINTLSEYINLTPEINEMLNKLNEKSNMSKIDQAALKVAEFVKDYIDAREQKIKDEYEKYADEAANDAVDSANNYTDVAIIEHVSTSHYK